MYLWGSEDSDSFRTCVAEHVDGVVNRYRGRVQLWQCAARLNIKNDFDHDEEQRLRLAVLTVETIRRADPRTPVVLTVDQPWGSFMSHEDYDLSPLQFVDALVRADLGLAGVGLEINYAYPFQGSEPRDVLEVSRLVDRFSLLGLPLLLVLSVPSSSAADPQARLPSSVANYSRDAALSVEAQRAWGEQFLSVLLAKQAVQGIVWNQLSDSAPHRFAHGGLFDAQDHAKPIVEVVQRLRSQYVM
jgi:hypothetical protein